MTTDGKGVVMRKEDLRAAERKPDQNKTRLSKGEKRNRGDTFFWPLMSIGEYDRTDYQKSDSFKKGVGVMKRLRKAYWATAIFLFCMSGAFSEAQAIHVGSSEKAVETELGVPGNVIKSGNKKTLLYGGGTVEILNGKVIAIDGTPQPRQDKYPAWGGGGEAAPAMTTGRQETKAPMAPAIRGSADVQDIRQGGSNVDLKRILVSGKITVVAFYADWCPSCRKAMPMLDKMAAEDKSIAVRKINIDTWGTPVAKKYGVSNIPNIRVFNSEGKQVDEPTSSPESVLDSIEKAKKQ